MKLKNHKQAIIGYLFAAPALLGVAIFYVIPYFMSLFYSFTSGVGSNDFVGLNNYRSLLTNDSFLLALKNTAVFSIIAIPAVMILAFLFTLLLNSITKNITFFRSSFLIPMIVPIASIILVWQIAFADNGLLNSLLNKLGLEPVYFLKGNWAMAVIILMFVWKNCGYHIILFTAGLSKIPKELYEVAKLDGASGGKVMRHITIPMLMPTTFFVFLISVISSFKIFREVYMLAGKYPDTSIYLLQHFMNNNFYNLDYARLSSASTILSVFIIVIMLVFFLFEKRSNYME